MPPRKPARGNKESRRQRQSEDPPPRSPFLAYAGLIVGTLLFTIIFAATTMKRDGLLHAMLRTDMRSVNWDHAQIRYDSKNENNPISRRLEAVASLLSTVDYINDDRLTTERAIGFAYEQLAADPDNLLSRVAFAVISDRHSASRQSPMERFESARRIIEEPAQTVSTTLYGQHARDQWFDSFKDRISRPEAALAYAAQSNQLVAFGMHNRVLPLIQSHIEQLANRLVTDGHTEEAATCRGWMVTCIVGLIRSEPDASVKLLCAELLGRTLEQDDPRKARLAQLKSDFHGHANTAPPDLGDQSEGGFGSPAVDPAEYAAASSWLMLGLAFAFLGIGAALSVVLTALLAAVARITGGKADPRHDQQGQARSAVAVLLIGSILAAGVFAMLVAHKSIPSFYWIMYTVSLLLACGAALVVAGAANWRKSAVLATPVVCIVGLALPSTTIAQTGRILDNIGGAVVVFPGLLIPLMVLIAHALAGSRRCNILLVALLGLFINSVLACATLPFQISADKRHQAAALRGHADEMTARLGENWQAKYLDGFIDTP